MTLDKVISETEQRMKKGISTYEDNLRGVRTNRATPSLLSNIKIDYHGQKMQIEHLAQVTVDKQRSLLIQPWVPDVEDIIAKAIQTSDMGINPEIVGKTIRLQLPALSEERRLELVKLVKRISEEARVVIRNIRRDTMDDMKNLEKSGEHSQDEIRRYQKRLQGLTDSYIQKIGALTDSKEKELMQV